MRVQLKNASHGKFELDIPMSVAEIKFVDFTEARAIDTSEPAGWLAFAQKFCTGPLHLLPLADSEAPTVQALKPGDRLGLIELVYHLQTIINDYEPDEAPSQFQLLVGGRKNAETYTVTQQRAEAHTGARTELTVGEVIETLYLHQVAAEQRGATQVLSEQLNIDFNLSLTEAAVLIRKPGEQLPSDRADLEKFIEARKRLFATFLTLKDALDLRNFLIAASVKYATEKTFSSFGPASRSRWWRRKDVTPTNRKLRRLKSRLRRLSAAVPTSVWL